MNKRIFLVSVKVETMALWGVKYVVTCLLWFHVSNSTAEIPIIINTWAYPQAAEKVWSIMKDQPMTAVDAVTLGASTCEELQCGFAVGFGGTPDENGETTLDAMVFDGARMDMGAVGGLRRIKGAMHVARYLLEYTKHSFIVGDLATKFATNLNFTEETLATNYSLNIWEEWKTGNCQPNFWRDVVPDPTKSCGPYQPATISSQNPWHPTASKDNHDTIGVISVDKNGNVAAGTSTNGLTHKIPGRVGDSPLPGAGAYAENGVGGAVATGDGDIMMRFLPTFVAVEQMKNGATPTEAAREAVKRIKSKYPEFFGAVLATNNKGEFGAACNGMESFPFAVGSEGLKGVAVMNVTCTLEYI